jgi:hypothetical protein
MKKFMFLASISLLTIGANAQQIAKNKIKASKNKAAATAAVVAPMAKQVVEVPAQTVAPVEAKKVETLLAVETTHDFGKIPQGKAVTTEFVFKNIGTDSLKLSAVQAGCGCTTPEWQPGPYAAGSEFKIKVGYNAASEGPFNKPVTITYADGQQKIIYITGTVFSTPATPAPAAAGANKVGN